jgi:hypothetical protein
MGMASILKGVKNNFSQKIVLATNTQRHEAEKCYAFSFVPLCLGG